MSTAVVAAILAIAIAIPTADADVNYYMQQLNNRQPQPAVPANQAAMPEWLQKQGQSSNMRFENRKQAIELMYADFATINADFLRVLPYTIAPGLAGPAAPFGRELYARLSQALVGDGARNGVYPRLPLNFQSFAEYDRFRAQLRVVLQRSLTRALTPVAGGGYGVTAADLIATPAGGLAVTPADVRDQYARMFTVVKQMGTATGFYSGNPSKLVGHYFERKRAVTDAARALAAQPPVQCAYKFTYVWYNVGVAAMNKESRWVRATGMTPAGAMNFAQAGVAGAPTAPYECSDADLKIYSPILAIGLMKHHGLIAGGAGIGPLVGAPGALGPEINTAAVDGDTFHVFKAMGMANPPRGSLEAYPEIRAFQEYWSIQLGKEVDFKLEMTLNAESDYEWAGSNVTVARIDSTAPGPAFLPAIPPAGPGFPAGAGLQAVMMAGADVLAVDAWVNNVMTPLRNMVRNPMGGAVVAGVAGAAGPAPLPMFPPVMSALVGGVQPLGTVPMGAAGGVANIPDRTAGAHHNRVAELYGW